MDLPPLIERLRAAPGFWPSGWEPEHEGERLGVRCGGRWVVPPRSSGWMIEIDVADTIQHALDRCVESIGMNGVMLAARVGAAVIREAREFETSAGRMVPLTGFRRVVMSRDGHIVAGPTASAKVVLDALAALDTSDGGKVAGRGGERDSVGPERGRSATTPRG